MFGDSKWAKARLILVGVLLVGSLRVGDAVGQAIPYGPPEPPAAVGGDNTVELSPPDGVSIPPGSHAAWGVNGVNPYEAPSVPGSAVACEGVQKQSSPGNWFTDGLWFRDSPNGSWCSKIVKTIVDVPSLLELPTDPTSQFLIWGDLISDDHPLNLCKRFPYSQTPLFGANPPITCNCECRGSACSNRDREWDGSAGLTRAQFTPCKRVTKPGALVSCEAKYWSKAELCDPVCKDLALKTGQCLGRRGISDYVMQVWPWSQATTAAAAVGVGVTCGAAVQAFRVAGQTVGRPATVGTVVGGLSGRVGTVSASVGLAGPILGALLIVLTDAAPCSAAEFYQPSARLNDCSYKAGVLAELLLQFDWWCTTLFPEQERQRLYEAQQALLANWDQTCGGQVLSTPPLVNSDLLPQFEELNDFVGALRTCSKPTCNEFQQVCPNFSIEMACFNQMSASSSSGPSFTELKDQLAMNQNVQDALAQSCHWSPQGSQPPLVASPIPEKLG